MNDMGNIKQTEVGQPFQAAKETQAGKPAPLPRPQYQPLRAITQGLKGYIARGANRLLGKRGVFWQNEGSAHWIRDAERYHRCIRYIDRNPVEAGLCDLPEAWPWGSAGESVDQAETARPGEAKLRGIQRPPG